MALVLKDRVKETTTTTSTGTYTLAGAVVGYQSFSVIGDGSKTYYAVTDGTDWEVGIGTYTSSGTTLSRDTILESSNSGNAVNWGVGTKDVFCTYPSEKSSVTFPQGSITSNYTASINEGVLTNTTSGAFTVTLPASPITGAVVFVADANGTWGTNNLTIGRNGSTIAGLAEDLVCNISSVSVQLIYDGSTWRVYAQVGANATDVVTLNGVQTLTNKTISGSNNTLTNISLTTAVTGILPVANGGTNNAFFAVSGPATTAKTYTFPNENMSVGYLNIPAVADKTTSYSLQTSDIGKVVGVGSGGSITIPDSTFAAGDAVLIFNNTAGDVTITCTITTAYIAGADADVASVTLSTRGVCNILFLSGTACVLTGNIA